MKKETKSKKKEKTPKKKVVPKPKVKETKQKKPVPKPKVKKQKKPVEKSPIGIPNIPMPENSCNDKNCPFHGKLSVRGRMFEGVVVSDKMDKSVTIKFDRFYFIPKYERHEKRKTKIKAHNPPCINAKQGDHVKIVECRPLSKTKNFVVIVCERS